MSSEVFVRVVDLTPSSASVTSSPPVTMAAGCPTSTVRPDDDDTDAAVSPADVTMIGVPESVCRDDGTLICSGGGAGVAPPRGLACSGGGAWACTICCSRGGGGVLCICCSGGGCRGDVAGVAVTETPPEGSCVCLMMILVTVGGFGAGATGGGWGLMAPVRERVVT